MVLLTFVSVKAELPGDAQATSQPRNQDSSAFYGCPRQDVAEEARFAIALDQTRRILPVKR
jgi:hypothetical protein